MKEKIIILLPVLAIPMIFLQIMLALLFVDVIPLLVTRVNKKKY